MVSINSTLKRNNYSRYMIAAPTICYKSVVFLTYVEGLSKNKQKICGPYNISRALRSVTTLPRYVFRLRSPIEQNMTKNYVYDIPCSRSKKWKGEKCRPLKIGL